MLENLRKPHSDVASLLLRLGLGAIFLAHGYIKVCQPLSWTTQLSRPMQQVVGWTELTCGLLLFVGLLSRLASLGVLGIMIGAIAVVTGRREFIDVDLGLQGFNFRASGYEYNVIIIIACLAVLALGSGLYSLDRLIFCRRKNPSVGAPSVGEPPLSPVVPTTP